MENRIPENVNVVLCDCGTYDHRLTFVHENKVTNFYFCLELFLFDSIFKRFLMFIAYAVEFSVGFCFESNLDALRYKNLLKDLLTDYYGDSVECMIEKVDDCYKIFIVLPNILSFSEKIGLLFRGFFIKDVKLIYDNDRK